jgi:purine-binding chemotaxis protein CheW
MRPSVGRSDANQKSLVAFIVGQVRYAIDIAYVREIVTPLPLTQLPHTPEGFAGVADHRNQVVPIVDLRRRFGLPDHLGSARKVKWVLVDVASKTLGLVVDDVLGVLRVSPNDFRVPPDLGSGEDRRAIASVTTYDKKLIFVLDLSRLESVARLDVEALLASASQPMQEDS